MCLTSVVSVNDIRFYFPSSSKSEEGKKQNCLLKLYAFTGWINTEVSMDPPGGLPRQQVTDREDLSETKLEKSMYSLSTR